MHAGDYWVMYPPTAAFVNLTFLLLVCKDLSQNLLSTSGVLRFCFIKKQSFYNFLKVSFCLRMRVWVGIWAKKISEMHSSSGGRLFPVGGLWLFFTSHGCYRSSSQGTIKKKKGRLFGIFRIACSCNQKKILHRVLWMVHRYYGQLELYTFM